jgi:hypothetical protein
VSSAAHNKPPDRSQPAASHLSDPAAAVSPHQSAIHNKAKSLRRLFPFPEAFGRCHKYTSRCKSSPLSARTRHLWWKRSAKLGWCEDCESWLPVEELRPNLWAGDWPVCIDCLEDSGLLDSLVSGDEYNEPLADAAMEAEARKTDPEAEEQC